MKFPVDAPQRRVLGPFALLGFRVVRPGNHVSLERKNSDETTTPMTIPNHATIKSSTLRTVCTQAGISREDFLRAYAES